MKTERQILIEGASYGMYLLRGLAQNICQCSPEFACIRCEARLALKQYRNARSRSLRRKKGGKG
jgi:hypothetical protein